MKFQKAHNLPSRQPTAEHVRQFLVSHSAGTLLVDGTAKPRNYVIDRATGYPVSPADEWMVQGSDWVLCVPDDSPGCLQFMVQPETLNPRASAAFDRYLAYHGQAQGLKFVRWTIESVKAGNEMFDGEEVRVEPMPPALESSMIKQLNMHPDRFAAAVQKVLEKVWADPRAVGVDWWGIDVASRFGATRIDFERKITAADCEAAVLDLLALGQA